MTVYNFEEQLRLGEAGERIIDRTIAFHVAGERIIDRTIAFHEAGPLIKASMLQQVNGIDRILVLKSGRTLTLEYKTDFAAQKTGRVFIETVKNVEADRPGWALTVTADRLVWYLPGLGTEKGTGVVIVVPTDRFIDNVLEWVVTHKTLNVANETYYAQGIAVKVAEIRRLASKAFDNISPDVGVA